MIPVDNTQTIDSIGNSRSVGVVTATLKNIPFLINAVTDRIYKDKCLAIIREYSTNSADEHIKAKLPINDIIITLPTLNDPTLRIRDFGSGLSKDDVTNIYCILGESTKRGSNIYNGCLGLGCKASFGYGDSFLVTSWINDKKSIYNIIKGDDHKLGDVLLMSEEDMQIGERTGIEVAVPIKISDLHTIHAKAADFYKYWAVLPTIVNMDNVELARMNEWRNSAEVLSGEDWKIRPKKNKYNSYGETVAIMGQVAYPVDWNMLSSKLALTPQKRIFTEILRSNEVVLNFPIGDLKFTINREELEYTETTYKNLEDKIESIFTALETAVISKFSDAKTIWEAKRIYLALFGKNISDKEDSEDVSGDSALNVLDGDFYRLESMFKGRLFWNGILMETPHFPKINRFDVEEAGIKAFDHVPVVPCMVTYTKKGKQVKKHRCSYATYDKITPYNGVKVVIMDGRNISMMQTIARYFILGHGVSKLHLLRFSDDDQRNEFFEEYHFDTAEYTLLSTILEDIKQWQKDNRKTYSRGGSGDGGTARLKYIDVATNGVKESDVSLRDLENGGVFLSYYRKNATVNYGSWEINRITSSLHELSKFVDWDLDRVYLIPKGKMNAKWFCKAKSEGLWTELGAYVKENGEVTVTDDMKKKYHYNTWQDSFGHNSINFDWAKALATGLQHEHEDFNACLEEVVGCPEPFDSLIQALNLFGLPAISFGKSPVFGKPSSEIMKKYPLLKWMEVTGYSNVIRKKLEGIIEYIESVDAQKKVLTPELSLV